MLPAVRTRCKASSYPPLALPEAMVFSLWREKSFSRGESPLVEEAAGLAVSCGVVVVIGKEEGGKFSGLAGEG